MGNLGSIWLRIIYGMLCTVVLWPALGQQNWQMDHLSTEDGLSQGMIYSILQDRDGFIWMGTKDGLNRYDGSTFKVFTNDPEDPTSISGNTVTLLYEDSKGYIWAASQNSGLNIYDKRTGIFHHIKHIQQQAGGISGNDITAILEDDQGNYILSVAGLELNIFSLDDDFFEKAEIPEIQRLRIPPQEHRFPNELVEIRNIYMDKDDNVCVLGDQYLYHLDLSNWTLQEMGLADSSFVDFYYQNDNSYWAFKRNGQLFFLNGKDTVEVANLTFTPHNFIVEQGTVYYVNNAGLFYFDYDPVKNKISNFQSHSFEYGLTPSSMIKDRSGLLWIGTKGHGLKILNLNTKRFNHITPNRSFSDMALLNGELILKTWASGWMTTSDMRAQHLNPAGKAVWKILQLSEQSTFYKYFHQDLAKIFYEKRNEDNTVEFSFDSNFSQDEYDPVILSSEGDIIAAGANNKLAIIDPTNGAYKIYDLDYELVTEPKEFQQQKPSRAMITTLYEDANKTLWVGTNQGFMTVDLMQGSSKLKVVRYQNEQQNNASLSYNHVTCFLPDPVSPERFMWVATKGGGLNKMDLKTKKFIRFSKEDGLPDNVIYGILSDEDSNIWGSTNKGIFCMMARGAEAKTVFRNFKKSDGLQEDEFNTNAFLKLPDGRLAFGGINGANIFDPKLALQEEFKPPIFITGISVNNQALTPFDSTGLLTHTPEYTSELTLNPKHGLLNIQYASLDFRGTDQVQYRYQLKGLSDDWVKAGNQQSASFISLAPGDYEFIVQGTNSQNQWSEQKAKIRITVLAPWYLSWWAYLLYSLLIVVAIRLYFQFSLRRAKLQQQLAYEKQEADRVRELDALKTRLFTNMTHEFRTPLTVIIGMAQQVVENPKAHFKGGMKMILNNGQHLLEMVNKMLDLSKLESGKMSLDLVQADIVLFLRNIVESFRSFAAKKEIQLHFLPEVERVMMDFDPDKLQQVITNLLSNAFKFTPDGGHIYFSLRQENESINIRVKDTGCGIKEKDQDQIFDRFYQTNNSSTREFEGSGIGLALCKELVTLMGGEITLQSPPVGTKKGAEFKVTLPIRQESVLADEEHHRYFKPYKNLQFENQFNGFTSNIESVTTIVPPLENGTAPLILLVEDNADVVSYIASCLGDYRLLVAENGKKGFEIAAELIPDLIISDVMMPIMNGFELCQQLKSDERTDHIPVILLTARADMDSRMEGLKLGANAYLPKPFEKQELLLSIKNLMKLRKSFRKHYQHLVGLSESDGIPIDEANISKPEDAFVIRVREIIEARMSDFNLTVEKVAQELHLSHSQLARKLDALTGITPNRFIREMRLKKAKELLQNQELSITAVAYDCGFNDPSYFTRVFKKEFGQTPLEWRSETVSG